MIYADAVKMYLGVLFMDILYASDNKFVSIMMTSINSVLENVKDEINIHIISDAISKKNKENISLLVNKYEKKVFFYEADKYLNGIKNKIRVTSAWPAIAFIRIYLVELLPQNIEKILYLDCDTLVCKDIRKLWNTDLSQYLVAGVLDCMDKNYINKIGLDNSDIYINSGVLLFNLINMRKYDLEDKFEQIIKEKGQYFKYPDQDAINIVMNKHIKTIPMEYNLITQCLAFNYDEYMFYRNGNIYYNEKQYDFAKQNFCILHMTSGFAYARPWFEKSTYPYKNIFIKNYIMANSTMKYWGDDNRSFVQKVVSKIFEISIPGKKYILRIMRKINNR